VVGFDAPLAALAGLALAGAFGWIVDGSLLPSAFELPPSDDKRVGSPETAPDPGNALIEPDSDGDGCDPDAWLGKLAPTIPEFDSPE